MRVILTHEQADFDALGALLGASLLEEAAVAVLPRRMNRNVRAFLNLYGADLPFIDPRDLPTEPIDSILLVDTQSLITLKGTTNRTQVDVVDHHQLRPDLPEGWSVRIDRTGAATTLFVEALQENSTPLSPIQATLLLLGIYEDTGSLTYASTTPRDARAGAYLLEQAANLRIASQHLNPPLSNEQRIVYERLLNTIGWHNFHGQNILIASTAAPDLNEEISSIAHKIRDLLDPDALFLLVGTGEGIRLVARSTSDRINVAEVAAHFGGGGHERAAAALVRSVEGDQVDPSASDDLAPRLEKARQQLLQILPSIVRPSITVGQIMSRRPRVLSPDTPAQEAALLMQRYGYEGYPVVRDGKVLGLLTRRAVDRALAHRLNLPAVSLMDAGNFAVHPDEPVEHLQKVMTTTGWGQVPVVESTSGQIVGIVTRTDLIKTLSPEAHTVQRQDLSENLEQALPGARLGLLNLVAEKASSQHIAVYIVGGFVRDLLLDRPSLDFDIVAEGDAISLARELAEEYGGQVTSHTRFGTAKWDITQIKNSLASILPGNQHANPADLPDFLDMITARTEFYERPTALPVVERSSIKLDLHRRDFTINTMALRLDGRHYGELHDHWGGLSDLKQGLVRVLHSLSFIDDPTRMLRAVRFEQRFGFQIEARTLELMEEARQMLKQVSGDRIRHELDLILVEERAIEILVRAAELNLLSAIHIDLPERIHGDWQSPHSSEWEVPLRTAGMPTPKVLAYLLWLSPLETGSVRSISARLRLPAALRSLLLSSSQALPVLPGLVGKSPSEIARCMDDLNPTVIVALWQLSPLPEVKRMLESYARTWRKIKTDTTGLDLRRLGLPPGPIYRQILQTLRDARLDEKIQSTTEERALLAELVHPYIEAARQ